MPAQQESTSTRDLPTSPGRDENGTIWKPAPPPFNTFYLISERGDICSLHQGGPSLLQTSKHRERTDHRQVSLSANGVSKSFLLHRLVYRAFRGEIPEGVFVHHLDDDPSNNHIENLALLEAGKHTRHHCSQLSRKDAAHIKTLMEEDEITAPMLADLFDVSKWAVYEISKGRTWTDVPPEDPPTDLIETLKNAS